MSEYLLAALAIRHYTSVRDNPPRNDQEATSAEISTFLNYYFVEDVIRTDTIISYIRSNVDPAVDPTKQRYVKTYWFKGVKHDDQAKHKWVFSFNSDPLPEGEETIDEAIKTDTESGNLAKMLKDPTNLDKLCSGSLSLPKVGRVSRF